MIPITLNGQSQAFPEGTTILGACQALGIEIPTLCHDERLLPTGGCRLCVVEIQGWDRHATACNTRLLAGMDIRTHSPAVEEHRRTLLELLAEDHPPEARLAAPEKPFHRWLAHYHVIPPAPPRPTPPPGPRPFQDSTHPYLHADFTRCIHCQRCQRICDEVQGQFVWRTWNRGADSRIRPGTASTLLEGGCVSCGACVDTCPTGALEDQKILLRGQPTEWTRTTCPYCGTGCEMDVGTREGEILQVRPALGTAVSRGHLCVKGRYAFDFVHAPDRVTTPLIRETGGWRKASWPEAIEYVARRLREVIAAHGPDSLGVLGSARGTNEENYLAQKFARVVLGTNNVDCCARVCHAPTAAALKSMLGTGAATNSFDDIEHARGFLLCGTNPTENHPIVGARIRQAVLKGATLVVIDPRRIELADLATVHLAVRPGTNTLLLNALASVIVQDDLIDARFVAERVEDWEAFRTFIADYSPEAVAGRCGVPARRIRDAAHVYARSTPAMCFHGLGMTEHEQGTAGVMSLVNLALLTGNLGRPGSGVNPLRGQNNVQGSAHMGCEPGNLPGFVPLDLGRDRCETAWRAPVPTAPGLNLMQMLAAASVDRFRALWAIGYDVAHTHPDHTRTRAALSRLDLVVVQDLFLNELAREVGHVFLPACASFERDGTFMNAERRVQRVRSALPPRGDSWPDWKILCAVATELGHGRHFAFTSPQEIWDEVLSVWPAGAGITYDRLAHGGLQWPCPDPTHPGTPILHVGTFPHGPRAPLRRIPHVEPAEEVTEEFPFLMITGRTLHAFNAGTMTGRTPSLALRPTDTLDMAPADVAERGWTAGDPIRIQSRHGESILPLRPDPRVQTGHLFATFHDASTGLNRLVGPAHDTITQTPAYKRVAVHLQRLS